MQLALSSDQRLMVDTFSRFLDAESNTERVRACLPVGFDHSLWAGLAELGALIIRVPEEAGGLGLGLFEASLLMEEAGRTLASGPLAEAICAMRLLAQLDTDDSQGIRDACAAGDQVVTLALHDISEQPQQLVAGGAIANAIIGRAGQQVVLITPSVSSDIPTTLASTPIGRLKLAGSDRIVLAEGEEAVAIFLAVVEEWKLLIAAALTGLARQSIKMAAQYACERVQFDRPIGTFQAISHPLADVAVHVDAGGLLVWKAIRALADGDEEAAANISMAAWWACTTAERAVAHSLHTFGGYGLTLEYDIHLYNLRAKAWPLVYGDPQGFLEEMSQRRYGDQRPALPDVGSMEIEFGLGDEALALAEETRQFFENNMTDELRAKAHYSFAGHDPGLYRKMAQAGILFPAWPKPMGGRGVSFYAMQAAYKVWDDYGWTAHPQRTSHIIGFMMDRFGTDILKSEALSRVANGEAVCVLGFSEPGSGSDVFAAKTRATPDGDGWRINGQKMFTSGAEIADYVILLTRTDASGPKHKGLTMFIVPLDAEGVTIQAVETFQEERTNITYYDDVYVPDSYRLGEVGGGLKVMASSLEIEHGMTFVRHHNEMLEAAERFCRKTLRLGQPMIEDSSVQQRLSKVACNIAAAQMLHCRTLWSSAEGMHNPAVGPSSKMFSSEVYKQDAFDLLNLTAPESLTFESEEVRRINLCFRHSQVATIYGGSTEVHRSMIAEKQLGLPRTR